MSDIRAAIRHVFRQIFAHIIAALGAARHGLAGAYAFLHDAVEEAVEPVTTAWPGVRDRAVSAGVSLAAGAGRALAFPAAFLDGLGSIRRAAAPTAQSVADEAVAEDRIGGAPVHQLDMGVTLLHAAAESLRHGGPSELRKFGTHIALHVQEWLAGLSRADLDTAIRLSPAVLFRHAHAETLADTTPLLPPPLHLRPDANADIEAMKAKALGYLAASRAEVAAMATRGPRPAPALAYDEADEADYSYARPAYH